MKLRSASAALVALAVAAGCGSKGGGSSRGGASTVAPATSSTPAPTTSSTAPVTTAAPAKPASQPATDTVPVILVHGHGGEPEDFAPFLERYGQGRGKLKALYAYEADRLKAGDLPPDSVVAAGFYRESATSQLYDPDKNGFGTGSIGGCPVGRKDIAGPRYKISYAARLGRIVDGVRRATGSDRVDLVLYSMGNLVGRSYVKWLSSGAANGKSKVRRVFCVAGPQRGINALEATIDGLEHDGQRDFMRMGECAEMCYEYTTWGGRSYIDHLNDGWDTECGLLDVRYGGLSATGAYGAQVDPNAKPPTKLFGVLKLPNAMQHVYNALGNLSIPAALDVYPLVAIWTSKVISEYSEATGPGDGTVRLATSRLDQAPFARSEFWMSVEATHYNGHNPEQGAVNATFTLELARQFFAQDQVATAGQVARAELRVKDAPGKASWLELDTSIAGGAVAAQIVEEKLDASGKPTGGAKGYGVALAEGDHVTYVPVAAGGGDRRYKLVVYGPNGQLFSKGDLRVKLFDGAAEDLPKTTFVGATPALTGQGPVVSATFASNASASDPSLEYAFRIDGGAWTAFGKQATFDTLPLAAGEHRLEAKCRHSRNGAAALVEDPAGVAVGIHVDAGGAVSFRK